MHARPIQYHALVRAHARTHTHPAYALTLSRVSTRLLAPTAAPRTAPPHHTTLASHCACTHTSTACVPRALLHCARRPRRHPRALRCNACACARAFARHRSLLILRALRTLLHISIADGAHLCGGAARRCSAARAAAVSSRARRSAMLPVTVPPSICTHARVIAASTAPTLLHRARRLRRQKRAALPRAHTDASRVIAHSCARSSSLCVSIASRRSRCGGRTAPQQQQPRAPQ